MLVEIARENKSDRERKKGDTHGLFGIRTKNKIHKTSKLLILIR